MKKDLRLVIWLISFLPLLIYIIAYILMGATIPVSWNEYGEVTGYISKSTAMFIIPGIAIYVSLMLYFVPRLSKKKNLTVFGINFDLFWLFISIVFALATLLPLYLVGFDGGDTYNILAMSLLVVAALIVIVGFIFPQFKYEGKYGFITPWTKASKSVFKKTQQIASITFMIGGLVLGALTLFMTDYTVLAVAAYILVCLIMILIPLLFSKKTYENED